MEIRALTREELFSSLDLVWKVFCDYEAVNYPEDGKMAFYNAIHSEEFLNMLSAYGAFEDNAMTGIIALRNEGSHVALFFVDGCHQGRGIGKKLWETVLNESTSNIITVNSSIYAKDIYTKLGFRQKEDVQEKDGIRFIPMEYLRFMDIICGKDENKAYAKVKEICAESAGTDRYYTYLPVYAEMLEDKKSYSRTRAFQLCCAQARWDEKGKLLAILPRMLKLFHDGKPTVVRQCLAAAYELVLFRPELCESIRNELISIDLSKYKDSMAPLIKKDIDGLIELDL